MNRFLLSKALSKKQMLLFKLFNFSLLIVKQFVVKGRLEKWSWHDTIVIVNREWSLCSNTDVLQCQIWVGVSLVVNVTSQANTNVVDRATMELFDLLLQAVQSL